MLIQKAEINHYQFTKRFKAVAFDCDGTLRRSLNPRYPYPTARHEWELMPNVPSVLQTYYTPISDIRYAVITNQSGIYTGTVSYAHARDMITDLLPIFHNRNVDIYVCPHGVDAHCPCRKPSPYALLRFAMTRNIKLTELLYVGDMMSDFESANRANVAFCWSTDFFGW